MPDKQFFATENNINYIFPNVHLSPFSDCLQDNKLETAYVAFLLAPFVSKHLSPLTPPKASKHKELTKECNPRDHVEDSGMLPEALSADPTRIPPYEISRAEPA
jgi:hypothetical protein